MRPSRRRPPEVRILIVASRFNGWITDRLVAGAQRALRVRRVAADVVRVPGAFELPSAARAGAYSGRYAAVVALGAVIRGETTHHEHIASACLDGLQRVSLMSGVPVTMGVITADNAGQAEARADVGKGRNLGRDAARAAMEMIAVTGRLQGRR